MENLFAETARRLARTCDPETSKKAAVKMVESGGLNRQEEWVYSRIKKYRNDDFTTKDIAALAWEVGVDYYKAYDICRKRFSGLRDKGKIELTGERRDGCQIWRLK